jgi:hypothetical protein
MRRYNRHDKRTKLPDWIKKCMGVTHLDLSTGTAMDKGGGPALSFARPGPGRVGAGGGLLPCDTLRCACTCHKGLSG